MYNIRGVSVRQFFPLHCIVNIDSCIFKVTINGYFDLKHKAIAANLARNSVSNRSICQESVRQDLCNNENKYFSFMVETGSGSTL